MDVRRGRIVDGVIVVDGAEELPEGAAVQVVVGDPELAVHVSEAESDEIRAGLIQAESGELLDAWRFLSELRKLG